MASASATISRVDTSPDTLTRCISETEVTVIVFLDDLVPVKSSGDTKEAKNGVVDVSFVKQGFSLVGEVYEDKKTMTKYNYQVIRLPSRIEPTKCSYKIEKDQVVISLIKKKERREDGTEGYVDWKPIIRARNLDQYDSSEDEDGNVPEKAPFRPWSDHLPFEVEKGTTSEYTVNSDFTFN